MGFRFYRRFRIAPGLRINLSKSGVSTSIGRRGAWFTIGPRGTRETLGVPGTGVSYTEQQSASRGWSGGVLLILIAIGLVVASIAMFV